MLLTGTFTIWGEIGTRVDMLAEAFDNVSLSAPPQYPVQHWHIQKLDELSVSLAAASTGSGVFPLPTDGSVFQFSTSLGDKPHLVNNTNTSAELAYVLVTS